MSIIVCIYLITSEKALSLFSRTFWLTAVFDLATVGKRNGVGGGTDRR